MSGYTNIIFWAAVLAVVFVFLWYKGHIRRFANYTAQTREELRKCTWPTRAELKGSTLVVMVAIVMVGCFTVVVDLIMTNLVRLII